MIVELSTMETRPVLVTGIAILHIAQMKMKRGHQKRRNVRAELLAAFLVVVIGESWWQWTRIILNFSNPVNLSLCFRASKQDQISLHRFPKERKARKQWIHLFRMEKVPLGARACSQHFTSADYISPRVGKHSNNFCLILWVLADWSILVSFFLFFVFLY